MMPRRAKTKKHRITLELLEVARKTVIQNTGARLAQRAGKMVEIINATAIKDSNFTQYWKDFTICQLNDMIGNCSNVLQTWNGGRYDKAVKTEKECFAKTRNFWCREKFKPIGSKLIHPILCQLYKHIDRFRNVSDTNKLLLYIDILDKLLHKNIKFSRTSAKPVILHTTFCKANKFKDHCIKFIECFDFSKGGIEWGCVKVTQSVRKKNENRAKSQYIRDPNRAMDLHDSFVVHLRNIRLQTVNCGDLQIIQYAMRCFMQWIENNEHENDIPTKAGNKNKDVNNNNSLRDMRVFQGTNYIDPYNRIHENINRYNIIPSRRQRYEARELHIQQMRMQHQYYNRYNNYPYQYLPCCCSRQYPPTFYPSYCSQRPPLPAPSPYQQNEYVAMPTIIETTTSPLTNATATATETETETAFSPFSVTALTQLPDAGSSNTSTRTVNEGERVATFRNCEDNSFADIDSLLDFEWNEFENGCNYI